MTLPFWFYQTLGYALLLAGFVTFAALYIRRTNRRLKSSLDDLHQVQFELASREKLYRLLVENMHDVVWIMDPASMRFRYVSPSVEQLRGYTAEEIMEQSPGAGMSPDPAAALKQSIRHRMEKFLASSDPELVYYEEIEQPCKDGSTVWTEVAAKHFLNPETGQMEIHGVTRDISARKAIEKRIHHLAQHDPLTDLPNRALFSDRLHQALSTAKREKNRLAVMFLDLDNFKPVNDTFGHHVGDALLQKAAQRIRGNIRESDTVARIGGDEFIVLLPAIETEQDALVVAEKIRNALGIPFNVAGHELNISSSIGIAVYPDHGSNEIELSKCADTAMYRAKQDGRNTIAVSAG